MSDLRWFHGGSAADVVGLRRRGHFPADYAARWAMWGKGLYLTTDRKEASTFGEEVVEVVPVDLKLLDLRDPKYRAMPSTVYDKLGAAGQRAFALVYETGDLPGAVRAGVLADGHDGVIWTGDNWKPWAVVFHPEKVRLKEKTRMPRKNPRTGDYQGEHLPPGPDDGAPAHAVESMMPDYYKHPEWYATGANARDDAAAAQVLRSVKGRPWAPVWIYRAVPKGVKTINPGDWVTTVRAYAQEHIDNALNGRGVILKAKVRAGELYTEGNSHFEFGWWPAEPEVLAQWQAQRQQTPSYQAKVAAVRERKAQASTQEQTLATVLGPWVQAWAASEEAYKVLDQTEAAGGTWQAGGCAILARALKGVLPASVGEVVVVKKGRRVQHYALRLGDTVIDADGGHPAEGYAQAWAAREMVKGDVTLESGTLVKAKGIPQSYDDVWATERALKAAGVPAAKVRQNPGAPTSAAFRRWFGDSKVVDARGAPLVVYHGAPDTRGIYAEGFRDSLMRGRTFFATDDYRTAASYADPHRSMDYQNAEPGVIPLYLRIENPLEINAHFQHWRGTEEVVDRARAAGHDGVIIRNSVDHYASKRGAPPKKKDASTVFVFFSPTQAKSAAPEGTPHANVGTYDPADARIKNPAPAKRKSKPRGAGRWAEVVERFIKDYLKDNNTTVSEARHGGCYEFAQAFMEEHPDAELWETVEPWEDHNLPLVLDKAAVDKELAKKGVDTVDDWGSLGGHAVLSWRGLVFDAGGVTTFEHLTRYFDSLHNPVWVRTG